MEENMTVQSKIKSIRNHMKWEKWSLNASIFFSSVGAGMLWGTGGFVLVGGLLITFWAFLDYVLVRLPDIGGLEDVSLSDDETNEIKGP